MAIAVNHEKLDAKIAKLRKVFARAGYDIVKECAKWFTVSAIKATPQSKKKKREAMFLFGAKQVGGSERSTSIAWAYVYRRRARDGWKKSRKYIQTKGNGERQTATRLLDITYRGAGKCAWLAAAVKAGVKVDTAFKPAANVYSTIARYSDGESKNAAGKSILTMTNKITGISDYATRIARTAIHKVTRRVTGFANEIIRKELRARGLAR